MLDEDVLEVLYLYAHMLKLYKTLNSIKRSRRFWVRDFFLQRSIYGLYETSFETLKQDSAKFNAVTRMSVASFNTLKGLLEMTLTKNSIRTPISAECRLFITLLYLAHGGSRQLHSETHRMAVTTFRRITLETCNALWSVLCDEYVPKPAASDWKRISQTFYRDWNMPNCIGAIDGKHIKMTCPTRVGAFHKGIYSLIVIGLCDSDYNFIAVDIGAHADENEGGIAQFLKFVDNVENEIFDIPEDCKLPKSNVTFPHYFVCDTTFPLRRYLMRPYPDGYGKSEELQFNRSVALTRRAVIENSFGILAAKWKILGTQLRLTPQNAESVVKACVALHNFLNKTDRNYITANYVDQYEDRTIVDGAWRKEVPIPLPSVHRVSSNRASADSYNLRDKLKNYLNTS